MDLKALIAKARAESGIEAPTGSADIEIGGELVEVVFRRLPGAEWSDLTATTPPRVGSRTDAMLGYGTEGVGPKYPIGYIEVAGEPVDAATWAELYEQLLAPSITAIATCIFNLNQGLPSQRIVELGKARAGDSKKKRNSPAN
jgi:hypothetical protein